MLFLFTFIRFFNYASDYHTSHLICYGQKKPPLLFELTLVY